MKKFIAIIIFLSVFFQIPVMAEKNSNYNFDFISADEIKSSMKDIEVTGYLPCISKFKNKLFEKQINQKINSIYKKKLETAIFENAKSLRINYKVKASKNIVSILIYFFGQRNDVETINFNLRTCCFISITDIIGPNGIQLMNKIIRDETIKSAEKYNSNFLGISDEHNFFVEGDNLIITFNEYELSSAVKGIQQFNIKINSVKNKSISTKNYYITKPYNLKMIPLREMCEVFGFKIIWNVTSASAQIIKDDLSVTVFINRNNYVKNKEAPQTLESPPQIRNDRTYVPVSFFTEYLNLFYSVDQNNTVTFSQYNQ